MQTVATRGWQQTGIWSVDPGQFGDTARGEAFTAYYERDDERVEVSYYVEETLTYNQPEVVPAFVASEQIYYSKVDENGEEIDPDYIYNEASALYYYSLEEAEAEVRRLAWQDESDKLG